MRMREEGRGYREIAKNEMADRVQGVIEGVKSLKRGELEA